MSEQKKDLLEDAELRPLRSMLTDGKLDADARLLGQAFQDLNDDPPVASPPPFAALEEQAQRLARRRRWRYHLVEAWRGTGTPQLILGAAAVAVLLVLGTLGLRSLSSNNARNLAQRTKDAPHSDPREHIAVEAPQRAQQLTLRCGAKLEVADGSAEIEQREASRPTITLKRGRVMVQVPPMRGGRLMVTTSDAEVIVHGTRFSVTRREPDDSTQVIVEEGLVEVRPLGGRRSAVFLRAGQQLLVPSSISYTRQLSQQVDELVDAGRCDDQAGAVLELYLEAATPTSDISGAHYLKGSCAAGRGDIAGALTSFEKVATETKSELRADNALARIAQLRAGVNRSDGVTAWQRYLQRFPEGQHRESAHRYLKEAPERKSR